MNERVAEIIGAAERQADEIRRNAEREAEETRRSAERDADASRREALNSADRVFERISSLERPLSDLVGTLRFEAEKVGRELGGHVDTHATAITAESESDSINAAENERPSRAEHRTAPVVETMETDEPEVAIAEPPPEDAGDRDGAKDVEEELEERPTTQTPVSAGPARPEPHSDEPDTSPETPKTGAARPAPEPAGDEPTKPAPWSRKTPTTASVEEGGSAPVPLPFNVSSPAAEEKRSLLSRLRPGGSKRPFIDTPGHCAVCQKTFQAGNEAEIAASGWRVNGDVGLCPEDQADGWQLPEGAKLPFRRGGN